MYQTIETKFAEAVKKGSLLYTPTQQFPKISHGIETIYSLAPSLSKKPTGKPDSNADPKKSPWTPPESDLLIEKLGDYNIVLNKFAVAKYHFMLVTDQFASQNSPLNEHDWSAALELLRSANKESGKRHIGFFNSGPNSGASISHKHIQFLTLPEGFKPFPDSTEEKIDTKTVTADKRVPFAHFILGIDKDASGEDVAMHASDILALIMTKNAEFDDPLSYNLVFTESWILATPRSKDSTDGLSINSLGTIGLLLAKSEDQLKVLEEKGLDLIKELGYPNGEVHEFDLKNTDIMQY